MSTLSRRTYPCRDCQTRHLACHENCERYRAVKERDDAVKKKKMQAQALVNAHYDAKYHTQRAKPQSFSNFCKATRKRKKAI